METNLTNPESLTLVKVNGQLSDHVKYIAMGLDGSLVIQLIKKSKQPHIIASTPKDANERFGDLEMFKRWLKKGRLIHWLVADGGDLAGIIWYGEEKIPTEVTLDNPPRITFAIRLYENYLGKGLSVPFMKQSMHILVSSLKESSDFGGIWLQTEINNKPAVAAYQKFGYKEIGRSDTKVIMVLDKPQVLELSQTS